MKQALLTFKQYLTQQDDSIDESDAIQKYSEYKSEFKRKQIAEFFDEHKEEDWWVYWSLPHAFTIIGLLEPSWRLYLSVQPSVSSGMY